jgi:hypothetical protein
MMSIMQMLLGLSIAVAVDLANLPAPERTGETGDAAWLKQAGEHVLTPASDRVNPVCVTRTEGKVEGADSLLGEDGRSCRLVHENGGVKPVSILDFGKQGAGGFAVFTVTAKTGLPVVHLAYACHPDGIGETGCTDRGSRATYLGGAIDLPVLPANVNRHETYSIPRTVRFIAPLVQGHTRYLRVQLDTPGTSVAIDSVSMVNKEVHDRSPHDGYFLCSDERLNRLWYISTWTLQIASLPNQNAWKTIDGWLLPRKPPEGYVHASPYAERSVPPAAGDYGPFPSDEFAAWLAPVAWDHLLYTGDVETLKTVYPAIKRLAGYLGSRIGENGLFVQHPETSKHACNLNLGDVRTRSYMNILLWGVFTDTARIANTLGLADDSQASQKRADALKKAIFEQFWDETNGCFREALETPKSGTEANALALSMRFVSPEQALRIARQLGKNDHGKFQSLASRGKFEYGFGQSAMQAILDHHWLQSLDPNWKGAATTSECMNMLTRGWGDESHPDTAIATHFSTYILGVTPTAPGFSRFQVRPMPVKEVTWAKGVVPTPHGTIAAGWEIAGNTFKLNITVPEGAQAEVVLPKGGTVLVGGKPGDVQGLKKGAYAIKVRDLPPDAWVDPSENRK